MDNNQTTGIMSQKSQHFVQKYPTLLFCGISISGNFFVILLVKISIFGNNVYICQNKVLIWISKLENI